MQKRTWIKSGIVEEFDARQCRLLDLVLLKVQTYYSKMYQTKAIYQYPLSLSRLAKLCNRSKPMVLTAVRILANSKTKEEEESPIYYDRVRSEKKAFHRPYRIFLR